MKQVAGAVGDAESVLRDTLRRISPGHYSAISGRHVRCGFLQSMPSSSIDKVAGVSGTTPSFACGQLNRPRSGRLA